MYRHKTVSIILPAYNEEDTIRGAIEAFFATGFVDEVIAVDNNSKDRTAEEIRKTKAVYVKEVKQGYGAALIRGLSVATSDLLVTSEPDGSFRPSDLEKLLIYSQDFDLVAGTRTAASCILAGANMRGPIRWGNVLVAKLLAYLHNGPSLTDVGCTFRLVSHDGYKHIQSYLTVTQSHFLPEYMVAAIRSGLTCVEVPVYYQQRGGVSKITGKLHKAIRLGFIMIGLIIKLRFRSYKQFASHA